MLQSSKVLISPEKNQISAAVIVELTRHFLLTNDMFAADNGSGRFTLVWRK